MPRFFLCASLLLLSGCGEDEGLLEGLPRPTEVGVHPDDFLGDVGCSANPGSMQSYVVTLIAWENSEDVTPFVLGSSGPAPCSLLAGFRDVVVVGQRYSAEIDGYTQSASKLAPLGDPSSGARQMVDRNGQPVEPRWTTQCATGAAAAVVSAANQLVRVRPCDPLVDAQSSPTAIAIGPAHVLGSDPCAQAVTIDITPDRPSLPPITGLACDAAPVIYDDPTAVLAGENYGFYVTATTRDATVLGSECFVQAIESQTVAPACTTPATHGGARVSLAGLMATNDTPVCPPGYRFQVFEEMTTFNPVPISCSSAAQIGPLEPGDHLLTVVVQDASGMPFGAGATCVADVLAGTTVDAFCLP
jgi:hypothetical protein